MSEEKKYYQNIGELKPESLKLQKTSGDTRHKSDILSLLDGSVNGLASRRSFLKLAGFSAVLGTVLNSCEKPIHKAIPFLIKPEEITPGVSNYYATSFFDGEEFCSLLVKSRDGRPIKIEGNPVSLLTKGGTSARIQASVLSLYDNDRYQAPYKDGREITWEEADSSIKVRLNEIKTQGGKIVLLTSTLISPTDQSIIRDFLTFFPGARHVIYDTASCSSMLLANEQSFGTRVLPSYHFDKASLIVSFDADFLGTWISPVEFTGQYAAGKKPEGNNMTMCRHIQFETGMSITGSNADVRYPIKPSEHKTLLVQLYHELVGKLKPEAGKQEGSVPGHLVSLADELVGLKGKSLVISGSNDISVQLVVNQINALLENYGSTLDVQKPSYLRKGIDSDIVYLADELDRGEIQALIVYNTNPVYHFPLPEKFISGIQKTKLTVSLSSAPDETTALCEYSCPSGHYLENWGDAEPVKDAFYLQQPLINPVFKTRQWEESLLRWTNNDLSIRDYMKAYWEHNLFPRQKEKARFNDFWVNSLQSGIYMPESPAGQALKIRDTVIPAIESTAEEIELHLYQSVAIATGRHANNPWLQEMPDPVTKAVWENYASVSPKFAADNGLEDFDVIVINDSLNVPVLIQPGQAYGTISIALGYGRKGVGKVADGLGANVYPLASITDKTIHFMRSGISFKKTAQKHTIARSQIYSALDGKPIVRETTLDEFLKKPDAGNELHKEIEEKHVSLYAEPVYDGFHWGLSVDLNSCTGCGACLIACQAENNIPVVGKAEVAKFRIMHWIRIDRYYAGNPEQPDVVHQPVMCMHCDNAPCENVCPVSATPHNDEGLNQVAYTRCIGTKYCINNCPYKVRKFNWFQYAQNPKFNYHENSDLGRLVLNPDVTVRERGVVEKCSFCVQRIQEKKLSAKLENRVLDGAEVQTACVQACPAKALVFGDLNNPGNAVSKLFKNERNYYLLEELHTLPSVGYLTKIRNRNS